MYTLGELSAALTDSCCPGNPVLKILNLGLTYDASCVSPQSRKRITGEENTPLFQCRVSSNESFPSCLEVAYGQRKKPVKPATHCPQVMHSYNSWQAVTTHLHSCYIVL